MQKTKGSSRRSPAVARSRPIPVIPREHAGKWVAWSADGRRVIAVSDSFAACQRLAAGTGLEEDQYAIERVPRSRQRSTGSGM
jgi:hypothetical protein